MKKSFFVMFAAMLAFAAAMVSCSDDDDNQKLLIPQTFTGTVSSAIPQFADFDAAESADKATITWDDATGTTCTIVLGAFSVHIVRPELPQPMDFTIGPMEIKGVKSVKASDGSFTFSSDSFDCMAGQYEVKGGVLKNGSLKGGKLEFEINYKPGTMPFLIMTAFAGTK